MPDRAPRRLLLLINSLEGGGAENVMARVAGGLAGHLDDVTIRMALLDDLPAAYEVDPRIEVVRLDSRGKFGRSIAETRRQVGAWRPDVVLSFLTRANCAAILGRNRGNYRCVISERVNTSSHLGDGLKGRLLRRMVAWLYPRADVVIAVSSGVAKELAENYGVPRARLRVINNPVDGPGLRRQAEAEPGIPLPPDYFVSVGRLVPNKGHDVLLRAFAAHRNRERHLLILGEGPERAHLEALAAELGVDGRVHMPGYVENPHAIVGRATAYVSASRSEGFPNALVEAMALRRAVAATDCPSGPAELLAERDTGATRGMEAAAWGILAPLDDAAALAAAMDELEDPTVRESYAARACERAGAYGNDPVFDAYAAVLEV